MFFLFRPSVVNWKCGVSSVRHPRSLASTPKSTVNVVSFSCSIISLASCCRVSTGSYRHLVLSLFCPIHWLRCERGSRMHWFQFIWQPIPWTVENALSPIDLSLVCLGRRQCGLMLGKTTTVKVVAERLCRSLLSPWSRTAVMPITSNRQRDHRCGKHSLTKDLRSTHLNKEDAVVYEY